MALDVDRIQAIFFDVDGTLSDTDDVWVARIARLLSPVKFILPHKSPLSFARWLVMGAETPGNMVYHFLDRIGMDNQIGRLYNHLARWKLLNRSSSHFNIIPQTFELLDQLNAHFPMAVVSARDEYSTLDFLRQFDLHPFFSRVVTALTCHRTKPFPDPILWAAEEMGIPAANCLMVGDTTVDILAGRNAGAQTVGVLCGFGTERELVRAGADLILPTPAHLIHYLRQPL